MKLFVLAAAVVPLYSNVNSATILSITHSAALVQVDFSGPTAARILYGPTPSLGFASAWYNATLTRHVIWMTGLNSGQTYYFRVEEGANGVGTTTSQMQSVLTLPATTLEPYAPQLPKRYDTRVPAQAGQTRTVNSNCGDSSTGLQALINSAQPGDTVLIDPGTTCQGPFTLPAKAVGTSQARLWITIRTSLPDSRFVPDGYRVQRTDTTMMPSITVPDKWKSAFTVSSGANHYRLVGLNIKTAADSGEFQSGIETADASASDLILDRLVIQSTGMSRMKWASVINGARVAIINSYIETTYPGYDIYPGDRFQPNSYCWTMHAISGPAKFSNNTCRSVGIGVFATDDSNLGVEDVEITQNTFSYDPKYLKGSPTSNGIYYSHRCFIEMKKGKRVLIEGNVFEDAWGDQLRNGQMLVFTPRNGASNLPVDNNLGITDLSITYNLFRNVPGGIDIRGHNPDGGWDYPTNTPLTQRVRIAHNLLYNIDGYANIAVGSYFDCFHGSFLNLFAGGSDYIVENNTYVNPKGLGPAVIRAFGDAVGRVTFRNNIAWLNSEWYNGGGITYSETSILPNLMPRKEYWELDAKYTLNGWAMGGQPNGYRFYRNVLPVGDQARFDTAYWSTRVPDGNFLPGDQATGMQKVGFVDATSGNFRLGQSSIYRGIGTDGKDPGVAMDALETKLGRVKGVTIAGQTVQFSGSIGNSCILTYVQAGGLASLSPISSGIAREGYRTYSIDLSTAISAGIRSGDLRCKQTITSVTW